MATITGCRIRVFRGGGSLDGRADLIDAPDLADFPPWIVTTVRDGARSVYRLDYAATGGHVITYTFSGYERGETMGRIARAFRAGAAGKPEQPKPVPASCGRCGRVFADASLIQVHEERLADGGLRCLPEERVTAELDVADGVYVLRGFGAWR